MNVCMYECLSLCMCVCMRSCQTLCLHSISGTVVVTTLSSCVNLIAVGYFNRSPENFVDGKWVQAAVMM